jgi:hypothetical protein
LLLFRNWTFDQVNQSLLLLPPPWLLLLPPWLLIMEFVFELIMELMNALFELPWLSSVCALM